MYDVDHDLYPLRLTDFIKKVSGVFILNGAYCTIEGMNNIPLIPDTIPPVVNSSGFHYDATTPATAGPTAGPITAESLVVNFVLYKKHEKSLKQDVHGTISYKAGQYELHLKQEVKVMEFLQHNDAKFKITHDTPLTLEVLREIIGDVRAAYLLANREKIDDVLPVPSTPIDRDPILDKIKTYLKLALDKGYIFDLCIKSTTDVLSNKLLDLQLRNKDGSKAEYDLITIELFSRTYEPAIILSTFFKNSDSAFTGNFTFIEEPNTPYLIQKHLTIQEADYFIKGIQRITAELSNYSYITDVTE